LLLQALEGGTVGDGGIRARCGIGHGGHCPRSAPACNAGVDSVSALAHRSRPGRVRCTAALVVDGRMAAAAGTYTTSCRYEPVGDTATPPCPGPYRRAPARTPARTAVPRPAPRTPHLPRPAPRGAAALSVGGRRAPAAAPSTTSCRSAPVGDPATPPCPGPYRRAPARPPARTAVPRPAPRTPHLPRPAPRGAAAPHGTRAVHSSVPNFVSTNSRARASSASVYVESTVS